jgi:integrase
LPSGASLVEAVDFYLQHQTSEEKCVRDAFKALIERKTKENKRPRTISEYKTILNPFVKKEGLRLVSEISKKSVESYIEKPKNSIITYQNRLRIFSSFFNFCAREGWLVENPTKSLPRKQYDPEEIVFLSLKEAKEVVKATKSKDWLPLLPYICCCMFCGLRPSEAERIDWSSISLKQGEAFITVKASGAKKRRRRIVEIPKNAQNLLALASKDSFRPRNFKRKIQLFRKSLSFEWSNNILRHSYGTYHFALHSNENLTASNMGNSPDILHEHYRALTTKSEGKKYFSIC